MTSFDYNGATVTFKPATGRNRLKLSDLRGVAGYFTMPDGEDRDLMNIALNLLYLVESVQGDLGFPVPTNGNVTTESLHAFKDGLFDAHEDLYLKWSTTLYNTRMGTQQDPDLLPPSSLTESEKKTTSSEKKDENNNT